MQKKMGKGGGQKTKRVNPLFRSPGDKNSFVHVVSPSWKGYTDQAMASPLQLNAGAEESHNVLIPLISLENQHLSSFQVDMVQPFLKVFHKTVLSSSWVQCWTTSPFLGPFIRQVRRRAFLSPSALASPPLGWHYLCSKTKASSFSGMFPRYSRLCLMMALAARHCRVVWFMGWMMFLDSSFSSRRSQAVCWKALVLSKWVPDEISRFMISGWPLVAAMWSGLVGGNNE